MQGSNRAVLWDLDGVLIDSGELHYITWVEILRLAGYTFSAEDFKATFGQNNRSVLTHVLGRPPEEDFLARIGDEKETLYRHTMRGKLAVLPGVREWLTLFREKGFKQAVASSAPPVNVDAMVDEVGIREFFDALAGGGYLPSKPDPAIFLLAAEKVGVRPGDCLVIEDSPAGIEGALRAGMKCLAVETTHPADTLRAAHLILPDLTALTPAMVEGLLE